MFVCTVLVPVQCFVIFKHLEKILPLDVSEVEHD